MNLCQRFELDYAGQLTGIAVLSAIWSLRVSHHVGATIDAQIAPGSAQAAALRDVGWVNVSLIVIALGLSLLGLAEEKRVRGVQDAP